MKPKYNGGAQSFLSELNQSVVLDSVRRKKETSRTNLSKELKLSLPTISRIIDSLIGKDYILEIGLGKSTGGKRPRKIRFNSEKEFVIGLALDINFIDIIICNLSGEEKYHICENFIKYKKPEEIIDLIIEYIERIINESGIKREKINTVGIGIPGIIENETNFVKLCPTLQSLEGINLAGILKNKIGMNVLIDNMLNMAIIGETWKGSANNIENAIFVGVNTGIGAGLLLNGKLYKGFTGSAGEIGYMFIDRNIDKKFFDPKGQFESLATELIFNEKIKDRLIEKNYLIYGNKLDYSKLIISNEFKKEIFEIINNFALGVSNLAVLFNPEKIIIDSELFTNSDVAYNYLIEKVDYLTPFKVKISKSSLGKKGISLGCVKSCMVFLDDKILSPLFL